MSERFKLRLVKATADKLCSSGFNPVIGGVLQISEEGTSPVKIIFLELYTYATDASEKAEEILRLLKEKEIEISVDGE
jgi:hypothetical protein